MLIESGTQQTIYSYASNTTTNWSSIHFDWSFFDLGSTSSEAQDETFYPIIVFTTRNSEEYEFTHEAGSGTDPYYTVNSTVQVLYDPENPYDAIIDQGVWNWLWPVLISFIALAFLGSGVKMVFQWMRIKRFKEKMKVVH